MSKTSSTSCIYTRQGFEPPEFSLKGAKNLLLRRAEQYYKAYQAILKLQKNKENSPKDAPKRSYFDDFKKDIEGTQFDSVTTGMTPKQISQYVKTASRKFYNILLDELELRGIPSPKEALADAEALFTWQENERVSLETGYRVQYPDSSTMISVNIKENAQGALTSNQLDDFYNILINTEGDNADKKPPAWYRALSDWEKNYFKEILRIAGKCKETEKSTEIKGSENTIKEHFQDYFTKHPFPTTVRKWMGAPNASLHACSINKYKQEDTKFEHPENVSFPIRGRSGTPVPYELLKKPNLLHEAVRITEENIRQTIEAWIQEKKILDQSNLTIPVLIQSLYNDVFIFSDALKKIVPAGFIQTDEGFMELVKDTAIENLQKNWKGPPKIDLISTAHSINNTRSFAFSTKGMAKIVAVGIAQLNTLSPNTPEYKKLRQAMDAYLTLQQPTATQLPLIGPLLSVVGLLNPDTNRNRQLELASLEQIIISESNGFSGGSCKSGKDRKTVEVMHTDSMLIFQELYGQFPDFNNTKDKEKFAFIFSNQFHSGLYEAMADQNAPGAQGLKSILGILPSFLCNQIEKDFVKPIESSAKPNEDSAKPNMDILSRLQFSHAAAGLNRFQGKFSLNAFQKQFPGTKPILAILITLLSLPILIPFTFFQTGARWALKQTIQKQLKNPSLTKQPLYGLMQAGAVLASLTSLPTLIQWFQDVRTLMKNRQILLKAREIISKKFIFPTIPQTIVTFHKNPIFKNPKSASTPQEMLAKILTESPGKEPSQDPPLNTPPVISKNVKSSKKRSLPPPPKPNTT